MTLLDAIDNNNVIRLALEKSYFPSNQRDQFFIKAYTLKNGCLICQGYIYFYIDFDTLTSEYIGSKVKEEYRQNGLASLLHASWIDLCLQYGLEHLQTIKTQRKPFLLYLLKKNCFELENTSLYQASPHTIYICSQEHSHYKYLLFKNQNTAEYFRRSKIYAGDNYQILNGLEPGYQILDRVLLSNIYFAYDNEATHRRAEGVLKRYK